MAWHWHRDTRSRDADGPHEYHSDWFPNGTDFETGDDPDMTLVQVALFDVASLSDPTEITIEPFGGDNDDVYGWTIVGSHGHDEGFNHTAIRVCNGPLCEPEPVWVRDVFAESMGY